MMSFTVGYFLLGDSLNTTVTVIATLQNEIVAYNTLQLTYLLIVGIAAQGVGILAFWFVQKRFQLSTKTMFNAVAVGIILLDGWGMIGIWTQRFGFHHKWEVWVYQVFYGLFVCPWYSYSQTVGLHFLCSLTHLTRIPATMIMSGGHKVHYLYLSCLTTFVVACSYPLSTHLAISTPPYSTTCTWVAVCSRLLTDDVGFELSSSTG